MKDGLLVQSPRWTSGRGNTARCPIVLRAHAYSFTVRGVFGEKAAIRRCSSLALGVGVDIESADVIDSLAPK